MPSRLMIPFLVCAALALPACRQAAKPEPVPLKLETRRFERLLPGCGDQAKREEPCVTFRVEWPEVVEAKPGEARSRINTAILSRLQPAEAPRGFEAEAAQFIRDYEEFRGQFPDSSINYFTRRVAEVLLLTPKLLSVEIREEGFTGGAHPYSARQYLNLAPATGEAVELAALVRGGGMERLAVLAERHFRAERGLAAAQDLAEAGFTFDNNRFVLPPRWGASAKGLVFYFNEDEIAPHNLGPTAIVVPWSELGELLRKDSGLPPASPKSVIPSGRGGV